jgi:hypothetical protein
MIHCRLICEDAVAQGVLSIGARVEGDFDSCIAEQDLGLGRQISAMVEDVVGARLATLVKPSSTGAIVPRNSGWAIPTVVRPLSSPDRARKTCQALRVGFLKRNVGSVIARDPEAMFGTQRLSATGPAANPTWLKASLTSAALRNPRHATAWIPKRKARSAASWRR